MDTLFSLPAHPFLIHIPIVLLPLAAAGVVLMAIKPDWHARYRWIVLVFGAVGTLGAILAASAGEELADRIVRVAGPEVARSWDEHAESGDTARTVAIIFFVLLAAYVLIPWWQQRQKSDTSTTPTASTASTASNDRTRWIRVGLAAIAIVAGAASVTTVIQAGHSGSRSVWNAYMTSTPSGG